jgi:capsular polysaccharide transport system permease protein
LISKQGIEAPAVSDLQAMRMQTRVIGALLLWEMITRYGRDNLGFIWLFLEPMIFTLSVTALWYATGLAHSISLPIVAFAMTGYSSVLVWRNCASRCCMAIPANAGLLYHRPVRVLDILITKILLEISGATMSFVVLSFLWVSIGWAEPPEDILTVLGGWLMLCWFGAALAIIVGALTTFSEIWERVWHPVSYIMFPLSGAVFMVDWLAPDAQEAILLLPMVHCVEMIREGYFGAAVRTHYDMGYVAVYCLVMTMAGLVLVRAAGRRVSF